jgi:uncharacterized protein YndB with AHSA1/START domain
VSPLGTITRTPDGGYEIGFVRRFYKPVARVWTALTEPQALSRWLLSRVEVELYVGGAFVIHFFDGKETMRGTIRALEPGKLLEYSWVEDGAPPSLVRWSLAAEGDGCVLTFTHLLPPGSSEALTTELGGGWHALLGHLETTLADGEAVYDEASLRALEARYRPRVVAAWPLGTMTRTRDGGIALHYERILAQPPGKVWAALTDPAALARWLGRVEVELRVGGKFVIHFHESKDVMTGTITALEPEKLIQYDWLENYSPRVSQVRWTLAAMAAGTKLTLTHTLPPGSKREDIAGFGGGWHDFLDSAEAALRDATGIALVQNKDMWPALDRVYAAIFESAPTIAADGTLDDTVARFERTLGQPAARVWAALTDPAVLVRWLGDVDVEPRVGGRYAILAPFPMNGTITAFEPQRLLEYSWFEPGVELPTSRVRWEIAPDGGGCRLTLTHTFPKGCARVALVPFLGGWQQWLDVLGQDPPAMRPYELYAAEYDAKYTEPMR